MKWVLSNETDFKGDPPAARSGHTAVRVGKSLLGVFGGLLEKKFLDDLTILDTESMHWYRPECTGVGESGKVGPCARAFHVSMAIDCHLFIFGGRFGRKRLGDFWMLDTDTWQWAELSGYGSLPSPREFAAGTSVGNGKIVIYGGWDGEKWLSDVHVLDTISLEWTQLVIQGPFPSPRCGHSVTMVEKRMLTYGGRGAGGAIMGDLWALKGLFDEEKELPAWTQLKLPGTSPSTRCGHSATSGGSQLYIFAGHSISGWLTRYDIYHNDCVVLDRASVLWKKLTVTSEPPPRAYHSMSRIGFRFLLFGGYDGKNTFGDIWWLVSEDDPFAKRVPGARSRLPLSPNTNTTSKPEAISDAANKALPTQLPLSSLREKIGLRPLVVAASTIDASADDQELVTLGLQLVNAEEDSITKDSFAAVKAIREHWNACDVQAIRLREVGVLLRDYHRLVATFQRNGLLEDSALHGEASLSKLHVYRFYHFKDTTQVRMDDIPALLSEYRQLLHKQQLHGIY